MTENGAGPLSGGPGKPRRVPGATYRVQLGTGFGFKEASAVSGYLRQLGITDLYCSPFLAAAPGSSHGYNVVDHNRINPELGGEAGFAALAAELAGKGMGIIMDVVPNHMGIRSSENAWWNDLLENGPSSPYASYFDIDWYPPKTELADKVLLPVLGDQYGRVLENREISIAYENGSFHAVYYSSRFPVAPRSWKTILAPVQEALRLKLKAEDEHLVEMESIITALDHLPLRTETDPEKVKERYREKEVIKKRFAALVDASPEVRAALADSLADLNGGKGKEGGLARLEEILAEQAYRLSHWRVASDEINYRRFFDINELAAIRVETPEVFDAVHALVFDLVGKGFVSGLRIDHVDGLLEPVKYFERLKRALASGDGKRLYTVVEKVLGWKERLRPDWAVDGTTGYDFLNVLNGLFVDSANAKAVSRAYERFTGKKESFPDLVYVCKKLILRVSMSSEMYVLARKLDRISEQHRWSRDFTLNGLHEALREIISCFPVYRTYITGDPGTEVSADDKRNILAAVQEARRRNPVMSGSIFDFIQSVLLLEHPEGITDWEKISRREFVLRLQQLTAPAMGKGVEDTAFYRYFPLPSINEVGNEVEKFGTTVEAFHVRNIEKAEAAPFSMLATMTHDAKRSEDVRARLNVISEMPEEWYQAAKRWREMNSKHRTRLEGEEVPGPEVEYLFYTSLAGLWPFEGAPVDFGSIVERIRNYMQKAIREAKLHTSWVRPNEDYEGAVLEFVDKALAGEEAAEFLGDFGKFVAPVARLGLLNSLSQVLLKAASPGVPDFYQGTETWQFSLVDPDNRRPVDYEGLKAGMESLRKGSEEGLEKLVSRLMAEPEKGLIKMHLTHSALKLRENHPELFTAGRYVPLEVRGRKRKNAVAFARKHAEDTVIAAAGRLFTRLESGGWPCAGQQTWEETWIDLGGEVPEGNYRDVLTGRRIECRKRDRAWVIPLGEAFALMPQVLLERER